MPRKKQPVPPSAEQDQFSLLWKQLGHKPEQQIENMDFDKEAFWQVLCGLMGTGATLLLRQGNGGESFSVGLWAGKAKYPATWLHTDEEVQEWGEKIIPVLPQLKENVEKDKAR